MALDIDGSGGLIFKWNIIKSFVFIFFFTDYLRQFIGKVEHPENMLIVAAAQTLSVSEQLSKLAEGKFLLAL